ncbi:MAG TPA: hypothetical protein VJX30_20835 [Terriglobales bacterium]|jgi:hypothetical protein|nr:hypothetical protein [Terriglobales bacterium]
MFETSGTTDVMEKSPWQKCVLWFAAGCFVTILILYMLVIPSAKRAAAESAEKAAKQKLSAELAKNPVQAQLEITKAALQTATQERDECKAKFDRQTVLYDNSIVIDPDKIWIIPADVEPIAVGDHPVTYTHYDPKTKRETVHFYPQRQ